MAFVAGIVAHLYVFDLFFNDPKSWEAKVSYLK